jgi:hypothetical protein
MYLKENFLKFQQLFVKEIWTYIVQ